jgi:hypothetical protein
MESLRRGREPANVESLSAITKTCLSYFLRHKLNGLTIKDTIHVTTETLTNDGGDLLSRVRLEIDCFWRHVLRGQVGQQTLREIERVGDPGNNDAGIADVRHLVETVQQHLLHLTGEKMINLIENNDTEDGRTESAKTRSDRTTRKKKRRTSLYRA